MPRILLAALVVVLASCGSAHAQSVTRPTYLALQEVQKMMEEERFDEARRDLEELVAKTEEIPYDYALANQYLAHTSVMLEDTGRARRALEAGLASPELPDDIRAEMSLFYGTVLLGEEEFSLALKALEEWYALAQTPLSSQVFSLAYANYRNGNLERAEKLVDQAIFTSPNPPESWYQLQYRVLFERGKHEYAKNVLVGMVSRNPSSPALWRMLASHYLQLESSQEGLATIMTAYINDLIENRSDLQQVIALYGYIDAPDKGARLLQQWLDEERLERNADVLLQLGNLWLLARERDKAIPVLTAAAELSPDGQTYQLLGGVYFEEEDWPAAYAAYQDALRNGGLDEPLRVSLLAGISAQRAGRTEEAKRALQAAAESEEFRAQATSLLQQLN